MAIDKNLVSEVKQWFGSAAEDDTVMEECQQICTDYNLSGQDLFFQWEAFSFNSVGIAPRAGTSQIQTIDLDGAKSLRAHIAREVARAHETKAASRARPVNTAMGARMRTGGMANRSPAAAIVAPTPKTQSAPTHTVTFVGPSEEELSKRFYRYMFEKISRRSEVLDDMIEELSEVVKTKYKVEELGDPSSLTEELITVVGRLCLNDEDDSVESNNKLCSTNLVLESSRMSGSGSRTPLKFPPDFTMHGFDAGVGKSLFPGEILALRGRNGGGGWFLVKEVLRLPLGPPPPKISPRPFSVLVASGPYTFDQSLDFSPFNAIIEEAKKTRPSTLVLLGPFIDTSHPLVKSGILPDLPENLFRDYFIRPIQSLLQQKPDTLILLVPHVRDILCSHSVFPQGARDSEFGVLPPSVRVLPNPCVFSLNGVRFGVSTVDVLHHIKSQQYIQRLQRPVSDGDVPPSDAMTNLCRHILEQRSFYPLFPVPLDFSAEVNLDVSHSDYLRISEPAPDVLILPSILRQFAKSVEGTLVINPSTFGKSRLLAQMDISAGTKADTRICDYAQVDLKRLN